MIINKIQIFLIKTKINPYPQITDALQNFNFIIIKMKNQFTKD